MGSEMCIRDRYGTIRDFGLWWAARNEVTIDISKEGGRRVVIVNVPKRMEGLAIMLSLIHI